MNCCRLRNKHVVIHSTGEVFHAISHTHIVDILLTTLSVFYAIYNYACVNLYVFERATLY